MISIIRAHQCPSVPIRGSKAQDLSSRSQSPCSRLPPLSIFSAGGSELTCSGNVRRMVLRLQLDALRRTCRRGTSVSWLSCAPKPSGSLAISFCVSAESTPPNIPNLRWDARQAVGRECPAYGAFACSWMPSTGLPVCFERLCALVRSQAVGKFGDLVLRVSGVHSAKHSQPTVGQASSCRAGMSGVWCIRLQLVRPPPDFPSASSVSVLSHAPKPSGSLPPWSRLDPRGQSSGPMPPTPSSARPSSLRNLCHLRMAAGPGSRRTRAAPRRSLFRRAGL